MKKLFFTLLYLFFCLLSHAQETDKEIIISNSHLNIVYPYVDNPMRIVVENIPSSELYVTASKGRIIGEKGYYKYYFTECVGDIYFRLFHVKNGDTLYIGKKKYRSYKFTPYAFLTKVGGKRGRGKYLHTTEIADKWSLRLNHGLRISSYSDDIHFILTKIDVVSYRVKLHTSMGRKIFPIKGPWFSGEVKAAIAALNYGDTLIIDQIIGKSGENEIFDNIEPLELRVSEKADGLKSSK